MGVLRISWGRFVHLCVRKAMLDSALSALVVRQVKVSKVPKASHSRQFRDLIARNHEALKIHEGCDLRAELGQFVPAQIKVLQKLRRHLRAQAYS